VKVVFYTRPAFLDAALGMTAELSRHVELHVVLEVSPESWRTGLFDLAPRRLPLGLSSADDLLAPHVPRTVRAFWEQCASFQILFHPDRRSLSGGTWLVAQSFARMLKHLQPDILHLDDVSLRLVPLALIMRRLRAIISVHDPEPHPGEVGWRGKLARRLTYGAARQFVLHNAVQTAAFCARNSVDPSLVRVVRLAAYEVYRHWLNGVPARAGQPTILFLGRLSTYKGLEHLYAALPHVRREVPDVRVIVAGRPIGGYLMPPAPDGVEVKSGYVSNAQLAALFQQATVVVCPYTQASQSGVVLTAYGFERPVVATAVGGLVEYVADGSTGFLVPPANPSALGAALVQVLQDEHLRQRLAAGIRDLVATELNWRRVAHSLLDVYQ
jgi:glycosyltransferase involved in cell wall biosynthesis